MANPSRPPHLTWVLHPPQGMAYEQASVHLAQGRQKEDWYTSVLNPMEQVHRLKTPHTPRPLSTQNFPPQVPCLVFPDGRRLTQSMAILEWL